MEAQHTLGTAGPGVVAEPVASVAEMIQGVGFAEQVAEFPVQVKRPLAGHDRAARFVISGVLAPRRGVGRVMTR